MYRHKHLLGPGPRLEDRGSRTEVGNGTWLSLVSGMSSYLSRIMDLPRDWVPEDWRVSVPGHG